MGSVILCAGLKGRPLPSSAVLDREAHSVEIFRSGQDLLARLRRTRADLVVLGGALPDMALVETLRRLRRSEVTRSVSVLVALSGWDVRAAGLLLKEGANAVLPDSEPYIFEAWITRLLSVPRRLGVRVPVQGHVVGSPREEGTHFFGLSRNISQTGMLLASPVRLSAAETTDLDLDLSLTEPLSQVRALARIVREAAEVTWPYSGYGVEFLCLPPESQEALAAFLLSDGMAGGTPALPTVLKTVEREMWIYELFTPVLAAGTWQVEIRRSSREQRRPGAGGPFYVVQANSPDDALRRARDFVEQYG